MPANRRRPRQRTCCGLPMEFANFGGVRIWRCTHRGHLLLESGFSGTTRKLDDLVWWHRSPGEEDEL